MLGTVAAQTPLPPAESNIEAEAGRDQIELWVQQLDDDRYDVRQRAQQELQNAGVNALQQVADAAAEGTLESVTRAVTILLLWSDSDDQEFRLEVLEKMANLENRPRESAMASRVLAEVREMAALAALRKLGAKDERDVRVPGNALRILIDSKWTGSSADLKHLADIPRVSTISFMAAPIDDSALEELSKLKNLRRVELYRTQATKAAADDFQKQFPQIFVDFRLGALLGVKGMPNGQCTISEVEENSAAHKAGIVPGDEITEFNGEAVQNFEALTEKISAFRPGESATLTIVRNAKNRQVKVTFGDWGNTQMNGLNSRIRVQIAPNRNRIIQQRNIPAKAVPAAPPRLNRKQALENVIDELRKSSQPENKEAVEKAIDELEKSIQQR